MTEDLLIRGNALWFIIGAILSPAIWVCVAIGVTELLDLIIPSRRRKAAERRAGQPTRRQQRRTAKALKLERKVEVLRRQSETVKGTI